MIACNPSTSCSGHTPAGSRPLIILDDDPTITAVSSQTVATIDSVGVWFLEERDEWWTANHNS